MDGSRAKKETVIVGWLYLQVSVPSGPRNQNYKKPSQRGGLLSFLTGEISRRFPRLTSRPYTSGKPTQEPETMDATENLNLPYILPAQAPVSS
jgi:hypothetical protein